MQLELQEASKVDDTNIQLSRDLEKLRKQLEMAHKEMQHAKEVIHKSETAKEVQKAQQSQLQKETHSLENQKESQA